MLNSHSLSDLDIKSDIRVTTKSLNLEKPFLDSSPLNVSRPFGRTISGEQVALDELKRKEFQEIERRLAVELQKKKRLQGLQEDDSLKMTREKLLISVSTLIFRHIEEAERLIPNATEAALLFHEANFTQKEWTIYSAMGYNSTLPVFYFTFEPVPYRHRECTCQEII